MGRYSILVVEDDDVLATDLAAAIEQHACIVVGPVASVSAAMQSIGAGSIDAAVLDVSLPDRDVTPVAMELIDRAIPFVIHTGIGLPDVLAAACPHVSVILKPSDPDAVVAHLLRQVHQVRAGALGTQAPPGADAAPAPAVDPARARRIAQVAGALFDQFGAKAIVLARRQADEAQGEVLDTWRDVIADLARRAPHA